MRRVIFAVCATATGLVLLLGFKTQSVSSTAAPAYAPTTGSGSTSSGSTSSGSTSSGTTGSGSTSSGSGTATAGSGTVTGTAIDTRFGPVQVKVTVANGKITSVDAVEYPNNQPRDQQINSFAIPQLNQEALAAGSANIDMVSGATYTSDGYIQSLQSALDQIKG